MARVQIFLSTVSAEFRSYRDSLRGDLTRPNVAVAVQEDLIVTGTETLDMLDDTIRQCDAVIHLAGDMTGALAQTPSLTLIRTRYPDLGVKLPPLAPFLQPGAPALSYTQWEAWLALYHGKPLIIAVPEAGAPRDKDYQLIPDQRAAQQAHLRRLAEVERYPGIHFANLDRLAVGVLRSIVGDLVHVRNADATSVLRVRNANLEGGERATPSGFDVFLSYSRADATAVEQLAERLADKMHFRVWLDKWMLVPGENWQEGMAQGLREAKTCAVCIGRNTPRGWFREEIQRALNRQSSDGSFRVIPIILPDGDEAVVDDFLELRTWVKFEREIDDPSALHRLRCGIEGRRPERSLTSRQKEEAELERYRQGLQRIQTLRDLRLIDETVALEGQRVVVMDILGRKDGRD